MNPGKKIVVYGPSGCGKSTFGKALGRVLGVPSVELDALFHNAPDWKDASIEEFRESVQREMDAHPEGWVFDGNYRPVADILMAEADTAVWLRLPFRVVYPRLVRRTLKRAVTKELLWGTNRERWRDVLGPQSMLVWGISNWKAHHRKTRARLHSAPPGVRIVVLRSSREVARYLAATTKRGVDERPSSE